ncbi:hydroxyacid dehydrogenase [Glaciimonas sp. Gout2]|uniref:hydroxyacid dehydrogenase n=1 Tax=unclassified Glaciimonas TaxID=2644401 RepID=UPI002B222C45|nr:MULTISPECIES: hydroxyacid dehydrogenase [unclassified Glaciimonas]MEB0010505.1 hydroxyacid dehydrogenase [Glaciimonas sp. Cout2]MEB0083545.1 hydroxyacid dehydrogenase [Glaciimonas sp. Gout2]
MKIVITEFMDDAAVDVLRAAFDTCYLPTLVDQRADLLAQLEQVDALIVRNRTKVDAALLAAAPNLKVVGRLGVGLDNIDVAACAARGIEVIPATGANARAVAEYVIGTAMALLRQAYTRSAETAAGKWPRAALSNGRELSGKTLGLIGFGGIGQLTARLAQALGVHVIAYDPMFGPKAPVWAATGVACTRIDDLLRVADIVSLHVPLVDQTRNLINATALAKMKKTSILINTSRGGIVDESALAQALHASNLGGAAIDVFMQEPLAADTPLADAPNLILTPHIAGVTEESNTRVSAVIATLVGNYLRQKQSL